MSGLIMTLSDDDDDQLTTPQSAEQRAAARTAANKLSRPNTKPSSSAKQTKTLAQQLAEAERDEDGNDNGSDDGDDDDDDFQMGGSSKPAAPAELAPKNGKKRKATSEIDGADDDAGVGSFEWDADATSDALPTKVIAAPSKVFQPFNKTSGTSLQSKIEKQLEKKAGKAKKASKQDGDSDEEMASSSDDENSESDSEEDESEGEDGGDGEEDADQVDEDVNIYDYKDDEVRRKFPAPAGGNGPKVITAKPLQPTEHIARDFASLRLSRPLLRAVSELGWGAPTPVQAMSILPAVGGKDLLVNAQTGSGKSGAFLLPILERLLYRPKRVPLSRVLVLLPTRELAAQCHEVAGHLAKHTDIRTCLIVGGLSEKVQEQELRTRPDIILATPGRLIDHLRNTQNVHLEDIEILVLDEADRLLDLGFAEELKEIIKETPKGRQTLLFSATLTETVIDLVNLSLQDPVRIKIDAYESIVDNLKQEFVRIRGRDGDRDAEKEREAIVLSLAKRSFHTKTIIFTQSKQQCHRLNIIFGMAKLRACELQGNMTQTQRLESLEQFRDGRVDYLICTDLAARGLDIAGVEVVINVSMPRELRNYIHRVGRTARAGRSGRAVTLVGEGQRSALKELVKKARDVVHSRVIAPEIVGKFKEIIHNMEGDIRDVLAMEGEEKQARLAEMEANKLQNRMRHQEEIFARPAKTWFQTPAEKAASKEKGKKLFESAGEDEQESKPKPLTPKQLARLEAKEKKLKEKNALLGLSRAKKRRKLMIMQDEQMMKERLKEQKKYGPDDLRSQALPEALPPLTLAQQEKMQRVLGKKAKKEQRSEKMEDLGITDQKTKRREQQAMQLMAAEKKKSNGGESLSKSTVADSDSSRSTKATTISGSNFRFQDRTGSGDDRYKLPHRKFKEEQAQRKKGEESAKPSDKKKGTKKAHHAFKSKAKFKRR